MQRGKTWVLQHRKPKLVLCSKLTMRLVETDHATCISQLHGLFTTKYKFWFNLLKHVMEISGQDWYASCPILSSFWLLPTTGRSFVRKLSTYICCNNLFLANQKVAFVSYQSTYINYNKFFPGNQTSDSNVVA